jgi:hypothetical protein
MATLDRTDIYGDRIQRLFGSDELVDGLAGFSFKSFIRSATNVVKQVAPIAAGAVATIYGGPAAGAAAYGLTSGLFNQGGGGATPGFVEQPTAAAPPAPTGPAGASSGGGGIVFVGVAILALVVMAGKKR